MLCVVYQLQPSQEALAQLGPHLQVVSGNNVGLLVEGGAVLVWGNDNLTACVGSSAVKVVQNLFGASEGIVPLSYEVDKVHSKFVGLGAQVAIIGPQHPVNSFTFLPEDKENHYIGESVRPDDFWAVVASGEDVLCISQGKANRDTTILFEYTVPDRVAEGTKLSVEILYRGADVTPEPIFVNCIPGAPLPYVKMSNHILQLIGALNEQFIEEKVNGMVVLEFTALQNGVIFDDPETGCARADGYFTIALYVFTQWQANKALKLFGQTISCVPLVIKVQKPIDLALFYVGKVVDLVDTKKQHCIIL